MSRRHPSPVSYWPAYVDAMLNVVLNILFLVAMFAVAMAVMPAPAPEVSTGQRLKLEFETTRSAQGLGVDTQASREITLRPAGPEVAPVSDRPVVRWASRTVEGRSTAVFAVDFAKDQVRVPPALQSSLKTALTDWLPGRGEGLWLIWSMVDRDDEWMARNAYLRALAVRELMLQIGLPPERIQMRLLPQDGGHASRTVYVGPVLGQESLRSQEK